MIRTRWNGDGQQKKDQRQIDNANIPTAWQRFQKERGEDQTGEKSKYLITGTERLCPKDRNLETLSTKVWSFYSWPIPDLFLTMKMGKIIRTGAIPPNEDSCIQNRSRATELNWAFTFPVVFSGCFKRDCSERGTWWQFLRSHITLEQLLGKRNKQNTPASLGTMQWFSSPFKLPHNV